MGVFDDASSHQFNKTVGDLVIKILVSFLMFLIGIFMGSFLERSMWESWTGYENVVKLSELVEKCEASLARNQHCKLKIEAEIVKDGQ